MKQLTKLIFISLSLLILGCEKDLLTSKTNDDQVHGSIFGIVTDNNTGAALKDIEVSWMFDGEVQSTETDENGWYSIEELIPGFHTISFSGEDTSLSVQYAVSALDIIIPTLESISGSGGEVEVQNDASTGNVDVLLINQVESDANGNYYFNQTKDVKMYSMNAGAKGKIYYALSNEAWNPVNSGVTVIAEYSQDLNPKQYTTLTDSVGGYYFQNIPAASGVDIKVIQYSDTSNGNYIGTSLMDEHSSGVDLIAGHTVNVAPLGLFIKEGADPVLVVNNFGNNDVVVSENITGTFDELINNEGYDFEMTFDRYNADDVADADMVHHTGDYVITWTDHKSFSLDPDEGLAFETKYQINISGSTMAGKMFDQRWTFTTQDGLEEISSSLEPYDGATDNSISKGASIVFKFNRDLSTATTVVNVNEAACNNAVYTTEGTCLCGSIATGQEADGVWSATLNEGAGGCSTGTATGAAWTWVTVDANCNVVVKQWNNNAINWDSGNSSNNVYGQETSLCAVDTDTSLNTVTLTPPDPTNGWGYKCPDATGDGTCDVIGEASNEKITLQYYFESTVATYDSKLSPVTEINIDD